MARRSPRGKVVKANVPREDLSETIWQRVLMNGLEEQRWIVNHIGRARTASGDWVTPTTTAGWPDLLALRGPRLLAVEVKDRRKPVDLAQVAWLLAFAQASPTSNAWVLRPTDNWRQVAGWIAHPESAPVTYGFDPARIEGDPVAWLLAEAARKRAVRRSPGGSLGVTLTTPPGPEQGVIL